MQIYKKIKIHAIFWQDCLFVIKKVVSLRPETEKYKLKSVKEYSTIDNYKE